MKSRTRRAGGGLAAELAGLANPAPVSTELPDDDFDPSGGAFAREADLDDASSSGDSDANAFGDNDEGVFEPTKAERAMAGKGKLRMRAGIAIDDGEYVGKSSSRRAMEGAWAGDEDDDASDEDASDDVSDDEAMDVLSDAVSDGEDDEGGDDTPETETPSDDDSEDEDEDEDEDDSYDDGERRPSRGIENASMRSNALEAELAAMRAEEAEANRLVQTRTQNAAKGAAVRTQNACWERSLRTRIVLQKSLTLAAKMPIPEYSEALRAADAAVAPALAAAAASARGALGALLRLQAALMDGNPAIGEALRETSSPGEVGEPKSANKKRKTRSFYADAATLDLASMPAESAWRAADASFENFAPFRDQSCDRWHRKAQVTSGKTGGASSAGPGGLRAFDQSLSQQVRAAMRPPDRLVQRSRPPAHLAPRRLGEPVTVAEKQTRVGGDDVLDEEASLLTASGVDDRVAEVYEDADFYEQALKEFLETHGAGSNPEAAGVPAANKPPKRRKQVDRRASKGRKLRYHTQQPLVNFCAPVEMEVPGWAEKVFTRLFASSA